MKTQLTIMLDLQDKMNQKVHPQWQAQNYAWFRAIWIECGELVEHYGYKWWKKQTPDMGQVQLEVVDIWHFGLSMLIDGSSLESIADDILSALDTGPVASLEVIDATEALAESILASREFDVCKFWALMLACDLSFDELFKQYVGKNVLNFFRQDHGYKSGEYIKVWHGEEDNEVLTKILNSAAAVNDDFADWVYTQLKAAYPG
jgi:dimeric dUTPase (all-alpha-NTP-PPase superfamily)